MGEDSQARPFAPWARHLQAMQEQEDRENQALYDQLLAARPELAARRSYLVPIPRGLHQEVPLEAVRRDAYAGHLREIIAEAFARREVHAAAAPLAAGAIGVAADPEVQARSDRICTRCQGGCCNTGEEHAYLSDETIGRYLDARPDSSASEILATYLGYLPEVTVRDSCVNQTRTGCSLPRELRSEVCNEYHCGPLERHRQAVQESGDLGLAVLVQRDHTERHRYDSGTSHAVIAVEVVE